MKAQKENSHNHKIDYTNISRPKPKKYWRRLEKRQFKKFLDEELADILEFEIASLQE